MTRPSSRKQLCTGVLLLLMLSPLFAAADQRCAKDSEDHQVCLAHPASRIIALSPAAVEQLYAAGAGEQLIATVSASDYPRAARRLPSVGDSNRLDLEQIVSRAPDLVVAWTSGNPPAQLRQLEKLGIKVLRLDPQHLAQVADDIEKLGRLSDHATVANHHAAQLRDGIASVRQGYANRSRVSVFYQVWDKPLITINRRSIISELISLCGGHNIFAQLTPLAPRVSSEAVVTANPEVIIGDDTQQAHALASWRRYPQLAATHFDNLITLPADLTQRPTPRLLEGARQLCQQLDDARQRIAGAE